MAPSSLQRPTDVRTRHANHSPSRFLSFRRTSPILLTPVRGSSIGAGPDTHSVSLRGTEITNPELHCNNKPTLRRFPSHTDRKSTRLNSSHANISYAVYCL